MLKIADSTTMYKGLTIGAGELLLIEDGEIIAIADGWHRESSVRIYRNNGIAWFDKYENNRSVPVHDILTMIDEWNNKIGFNRAVSHSKKLRVHSMGLAYQVIYLDRRTGDEHIFTRTSVRGVCLVTLNFVFNGKMSFYSVFSMDTYKKLHNDPNFAEIIVYDPPSNKDSYDL